MISFTIPGQPQGKARARTTRFGTYTPEKTVLYENLIKMCFQESSNDRYDVEPITVTISAYFEPPKSVSKKQRGNMLMGHTLPQKKPDIDNIAKVVLDALNGVAYKDDTQVVGLQVDKSYSDRARVEVTISEVLL